MHFRIALCVLFVCTTCNATLVFKYPDISKHGLAFPGHIEASLGHDLMVKLLKTAADQEKCVLRSPDFVVHDLKIDNNRLSMWGDGCGVRIKNFTASDEGNWKLISESKGGRLEGVFTAIVKDIRGDIIDEDIHINAINTSKPITLELSKQKSSYCHMSQTDTAQQLMVQGPCHLELQNVTKNNEGLWNVNMGVPGRLEEESGRSRITIHSESLDVGLSLSNNAAHLYCNLKETESRLTFCRFERTFDKKAFNLIEGLGKGRYSYFGKGFRHNECGLTIENLESADYNSWKCSLGIVDDERPPKILHRMMVVRRASLYRRLNLITTQKNDMPKPTKENKSFTTLGEEIIWQ